MVDGAWLMAKGSGLMAHGQGGGGLALGPGAHRARAQTCGRAPRPLGLGRPTLAVSHEPQALRHDP